MNLSINIGDLSLDIIGKLQLGLHIYHLEDLNDDRTLRMIYANTASELYTDVPSEKFIGNTLDENFPELRKQGIPQQYAEVVRSGKPVEIGTVYYGDSQVTEGWFAVKAFPLSHNCVGVSFENLTDKKKTEEALKDSLKKLARQKSLLQSIFKSAPIGINLAIDRTFFWVNEKFTDITGYSSDELEGQSARMLFPDDEEFIRVGKVIYNSIEKHGTGATDTQWQRKDGSIIDVYLSATTVDLDYLPNGVIFSVLDISDRKSLERALFQSKEEWEKTFDAMSDIVTIQNKEMRIVRANKAASEFFEMGCEDLIGKKIFDVFPGISAPCPGYPGSNVLLDIQNHSEIIEHAGLGKIFHVSSSPILDQNNEVQYFVHIAKDITEQKRLEEEIFQAHKMEAIGTLAGGIAHDFNNMLSIILGNADMALDDIPDGNPGRYNINQIIEASRRVKTLVQQILTFSRQTDQKLLPLEPCSVLKESLELIRSTTPSTVSIIQNTCKECGAILVDSTQFHQLLMNLCSNAVHAMDEKGTLEITGEIIDLEVDDIVHQPDMQSGQYFKLSVSDTGIGMDQETQNRIFEPFFTTKGVDEGTGMGLAIVLGIVENHGGVMQVDSEPGEGALFTIYFPVMEGVQAQKTEKVSEEYSKGNERILFVDDEEMLARLGGRMLEQLGYEVTVKSSSIDALETFKSNPEAFDLLITDQTMPNMSGAELAVELLKTRPDIPIILCTGYSRKISKEEAKKLGISEYVTKPIDKSQLATTIRKVLAETMSNTDS